MQQQFAKILNGYKEFRSKYAQGEYSMMRALSQEGQSPKVLVVACCDSRVDPALILQCDPGELFVVRNVANIIPPYERDEAHHGTSAALEFAVRFLKVKHIIILGHSQCGGIQTLLKQGAATENDFINNWVSLVKDESEHTCDADLYAKHAMSQSYDNCLAFPWVKERFDAGDLAIHRWFFDISTGIVGFFCDQTKGFKPLEEAML
ncbi:MAG: carbonate dehydratase [Candidatus Puniceispirillum sp.]|nr:carbonate dehydratase [Candidatus Puniceispirillum sp.]